MKRRWFNYVASALGAALLAPAFLYAQNLDENGALPRATPESVGVSSEAITQFIQRLDEKIRRVDSVMVLRDGKVIAEAWRTPYAPNDAHACYSLSKSFTSTALGFAVDEGKLSIDQKIVDIFPEDVPENPSENLKNITLRSLLSMSCGHDKEVALPNKISATHDIPTPPTGDNPTWVQAFMRHPVPFEPGTHFQYNTPGTYMCSAALQKIVGETTLDYLTPRLFEPLHIEKPVWEASPEGISKGGTGLYLKTEDIAKFGQFLLQKGVWNGKRLLSEEWIDAATSKQISNGDNPNSDWTQGYCFQFWRCRYNAYRGDGAYGQFCVVMPDQNMVVVMTSDAGDTAGELNALFDVLRPAVADAPLPENPDALAKLREIEKSLKPQEGRSGSDVVKLTMRNSQRGGEEMRYVVYLPNEYYTTPFRYPILYLLHGLTDDESTWTWDQKGNMKAICDEYFAKHPERKRIVVMPDARATWYLDSFDDSDKYETFFFEEFMPTVESKFRCKTDRENRAIAGLSMGGFGTLLYALRRPDLFSAAYAMSPAVFLRDEARKRTLVVSKEKSNATDEEIEEYLNRNDPIKLIRKIEGKNRKAVKFTVDIGDDDFLVDGAFAFFEAALNAGEPCEFRMRDGGHEWRYWRVALPDALDFFAK